MIRACRIWSGATPRLLAVMALAGVLWPQTTPAPVYIESFRKGPGKVEEANFEFKLDMKNSTYERRIKDSEGKERYKLSVTPIRVGPDDDRILSWQVSLLDLKRPVFGELLRLSQNPDLNVGAAAQIARLDGNPYAQVPLLAERIIKIDQFYCLLQVQKYHRLIPERAYLESADVDVKFTNTNPLAQTENH